MSLKFSSKESRESETVERTSGCDGYVLIAIDRECHRRSVYLSPHLEVPQRLARLSVERDEVAFRVAREYYPAGGRERSCPRGRGMTELPLHLSGRRIDRAQGTPIRFGFIRGEICAAVVSVPRFVRLRGGAEDVALLTRGHVEQSSLWIVRRRHPVGGADGSGTHGVAFERGFGSLIRDWAPLRVLAVAPGDLAVRIRREQFAVGAIDDVKEAVAIGLRDEMLAAGVDHDGHLRSVPIVFVVFGVLKIPVQLAGIGVERKQRVAVEIVAGAALSTIRRRRISRRPEELIRRRIVSSRVPRRRTAHFPGVALPGVMTWLARPRHSVEAPLALAGCRVVGVDEAANAVFTSRNAKYDEILHRQRCRREAVAQPVVGGGYVPDDATGFRIERNQMRIERAEDNLVTENRKATIDAPAARTNVCR